MDSSTLLDAIVAWSATHLALRDGSYQTFALQCRGVALQSLCASLGTVRRDPEMELAACLVHCALESISGDTQRWHTHIRGADQVIRSVCGQQERQVDFAKFGATFEGRWLLRSFAYHDIMATVSEDRKPLILSGHYWFFEDDGRAPPDSLFGLASRIMYLVSETSVLNVDAQEESELGGRYRRIETELLSWRCADGCLLLAPSEPTPGSGQQLDGLVVLAELYRQAALIHLWRVGRRHGLDDGASLGRKIGGAVHAILGRIQDMPERCLVESSFLFPLFLAGGETVDPALVEVVRRRMRDMVEFRSFHNVVAALDVLEELWHLRWAGNEAVDWRDILGRRGWMLSLT